MKQSVAKAWIKDLRTHTRQTRHRLYDGKGGHCCLGRLCRVLGATFSRNKTSNTWYPVLKGTILDEDEPDILPKEIQDLAGMISREGSLGTREGFLGFGEAQYSLASLNDEGKSFAEIADIIEKEWKHL